MTEGYLSPAVANRINTVLRPRGFATSKQLGNVQTITFHRDDVNSGGDVAVGPYEVLIVTAPSGAPQTGADGSTAFVGVSGEFRKESPFAVQRGDRFCLNTGACGSVISDPIADIAFIRAPFVIER